MKVEEYLREKGINYKVVTRPTGIQAITSCPNCGENDFAINIKTGFFKCVHLKKCGIAGSFRELKRYYGDYVDDIVTTSKKEYNKPKAEIEPVNRAIGGYLVNERKFKREVLREFKHLLGYKDGAIVFKYQIDGEDYAYKYRMIKEKKFWKEKNTPPVLFNWDNCKEQTELFITEGEMDVIALKHYDIDAVSIPNGASDLSWIDYNWERLQRIDRFILVYDNDEAGQHGAAKAAQRLGEHKCLNVTLPEKDVCDCYVKGIDIIPYIINAKQFGSDKVKSCAEYIEDIIEIKDNDTKSRGIATFSNKLTEILGGWRKGEVTVWSGTNGSGKSNILLQEAYNLANNGTKVLVGSFEMSPVSYLKWVVQMKSGENIINQDIKEVLRSIGNNFYCINAHGYVTAKNLYGIIEYAAKRYGVQHVIIDSLMRVKFKTSDIYKEQSDFIIELCRLADTYDLHIHLVAHPRKGDDDGKIPDKVDIAGASDITNNAHNVIIVYRVDEVLMNKNQRKKHNIPSLCDCILIVKKNREKGTHGKAYLIFDKEYKKFKDAY